MKNLPKMTWSKFFKSLKPEWHFGKYTEQKAMLAFEFAIVLSDVAHDLKIEMTREIVLRAEDILLLELGNQTAEQFANRMNVLAIAVLEPKEV